MLVGDILIDMINLNIVVLLSILIDLSAITPIPREHPSWIKRNQQLQNVVDTTGKEAKMIFVGDSITEGWERNGSKIWKELFAPYSAINLGIGGDRTEHVLWRLQNGQLENLSPDFAVVMIGTNNFGQQDPDSEGMVLEGVTKVVELLRESIPDTHILLCDIFPRGVRYNVMRGSILQVNQALQNLYAKDSHVTFLPVGYLLIEEDGSISKEVMPDYLHLSEEGYRRWADAILDKIK